MRQSCLVILVLLLSACALVMGCTSQSLVPLSSPTQTPQIQSTTQVPTVAPSLLATPGPVQTVPGYESIDVGVSRNSISENPTIITAFNGGFGLGMTERMDVTVIRSDGIVETGHLDYPTTGSVVTLMGTTTTDLVVVNVTMTSGDQYTLIDNYYLFPGGEGNNGA
jgi:hypothetical protein